MQLTRVLSCRSLEEKISWVTCYDYSLARAVGESDIDLVLVGDSGAMVVGGEKTTSPATMDQMILFSRAVSNGCSSKPIIGDMPRGSYEVSNSAAIESAMRFVKEAECEGVKLEGGSRVAPRVQAIVDAGITVIGHIGLTPQSAAQFGGYRVTGRSDEEIDFLLDEAHSLEKSGASALLVEATPQATARKIRDAVNIPVFGIGAGADLDGQLLILHDLLGLYPDFRPRFAKNYLNVVLGDFVDELAERSGDELLTFGRETRRDGFFELAVRALNSFSSDVKSGAFPSAEYIYA